MAPQHRLVLHVGVPKSGTTFLQASLDRNRVALREAGVSYPSENDLMFRLTLDVRGNHKTWGRKRRDVEGAWADACRSAREFPGTTVLSQEVLAPTPLEQVTAAGRELAGLDVHVVVTSRDIARQVTAEWAEGIKHTRTGTFAEFRAEVLEGARTSGYAKRFHAAQDVPEVLRRWGSLVPPENVHLVCAPPVGADRTLLWRRFGEAVGFDAAAYEIAGAGAANASLGTVEIDLLRRVNLALGDRLPQPWYGRVVKRYLAQDLLARHDSPAPQLPADLFDSLAATAEQWVEEIGQTSYQVHGDLRDLMPSRPSGTVRSPDDVDPAAQAETAADVIAELLLEVTRTRSRIADLEAERPDLRERGRRMRDRLRAHVPSHVA